MTNLALNFTNSLGIMSLIGLAYGICLHWNYNNIAKNILLGTLFGLGASIAMLQSIPIFPGVLVDPRSLFVGFSGAFLGPTGAAVTVVIAAATRIMIGGTGLHAGLVFILFCAGAGLLWARLTPSHRQTELLNLLALGGMISLALISTVMLPADAYREIINHQAIVIIVFNLIGALILGTFIGRERRYAKREQRLTREAKTDPLTGLMNRRSMQEIFDTVQPSGRYRGTAVIVVDLDHFKQTNDRYGHDGGDVILKMAAEVLREAIRKNDLVARFGGEEFVIILIDNTAENAAAIAERIRQGIESRRVLLAGDNVKATASLGVFWSRTHRNLDEMFKPADEALYQAKASGRNTVVVTVQDLAA